MELKDATTEDIQAAAMRALETLEGSNLYMPGPWPITVRPFAEPPSVIYQAADGKTYERPMTLEIVGDALNAVLGERKEVEARTVWVPVDADLAPAFNFSGDLSKPTTWKGLIFRAGKYPDKGCEFSSDDLAQFVANFPEGGVPVMSEHEDSLLGVAMDRHGARLVRIWTENGGSELHGEFRSPGWLDAALEGMRKTVSVGIDFAAKTLREISLVLNPRVVDAAVFALNFSRSPEFAALPSAEQTAFRDLAQGPETPAPAPARAFQDTSTMNFNQKVKAAVSLLTPEQRAQVGLTDAELDNAANFAAPAPDPRDVSHARTLGKSEREALLREGYAVPEGPFLALFTEAVKKDGGGTVTFSQDGDVQTGDQVKALIEVVKSGRKIPLGRETLNNFSQDNEGGGTSDVDRLLEAAGVKK
jgi:hypothetical protein